MNESSSSERTLPASAPFAGASEATTSAGPNTGAGTKPPDGLSCEERLEWHAADKRRRYHIEMDATGSILLDGKAHRLSVKFTPCVSGSAKPEEPHWIILYNVDSLSPTTRYEGPAWKRHHHAYYVRAALREMTEQGILFAPPAPERLPLPLPPAGPRCPLCGGLCVYETAHVGGRGTCWRHVCPRGCDYIDRWKS